MLQMQEIKINTSYNTFLKEQKKIIIKSTININSSKEGSLLFSTVIKPEDIIIAPLNANLEFRKFTSNLESIISKQSNEINSKKITLPFNWDWKNIRKITPVYNQYSCGCCWAVAVTTSISDHFICRNILPVSPHVSLTNLMSCYPDSLKCNGGNPALALLWIQENGLGLRNDYYNYKWCSESNECIGKNETTTLNNYIPKCDKNKESDLKIFVNNITSPYPGGNETLNDSWVKSSIELCKKNIYTLGPTVAGFSVLENFISGKFMCDGKNPDNIYFDKIDYNTNKPTETYSKYIGGHAIVVTGWNTGKVHSSLLSLDTDTWIDVPYWIVRNSWGTKWGIDGYFRIAMYPFNKKSQLDVPVKIITNVDNQSSEVPVGGFIFFNISKYTTIKENYESQYKSINDYSVIYSLIISLVILIILFIFILCFINLFKGL